MAEDRRPFDYSTFSTGAGRARASSVVDGYIQDRIADRQTQQARSAAAALQQIRTTGISVDTAARASALSSTILGPRAGDLTVYNRDILDQFEAQQAARREQGLLEQFSRTSEYLSDPRNAALLQEDVEFISNMEEFVFAIGRRSQQLYEGVGPFIESRVLNTARMVAEDSQRTLQDIYDDAEARALAELDRPDITGGSQGTRARRGGLETEGELNAIERQALGREALARYLSSRPAAIFGGEAEAQDVFASATEGLEENLVEGVVDATNIARNWPTGNNRREIDMRLQSLENTPGAAVSGFAQLIAERPLDMLMYMSTVGAESGVSAAAAIGVGYLTRSPTAAIATIGIGSGVQSAVLYPDELAQSRGYDFTTSEGRAAFLRDPATVRDFQDDVFAYSAVVALLDAASGGAAGRTLANSRVGNIVLQGLVQGAMGGGGEALGRIASGEEVNWTEVLLEAIAEVVSAPVEVAGVVTGQLRSRANAAQTARQRRTMFNVLAGIVDRSTLRGRNAAEVGKAVDFIARGSEVENVYIAADRLEQMFQSGELGVTREQFFASMPEFDEAQFTSALENGGDIAIPIGTYAARMAGTAPDAVLSQHMRFRAEEMSFVEAQEAQRDIAKTLDSEMQNMAQAVDELGQTLRGEVATEFQRLRQEIAMAQPSLSPNVVGKVATVALQQATRLAANAGIDPVQFMREYSLPMFRGADAVGPAAGQIRATPTLVRAAASAEVSGSFPREVQAVMSELTARGIDPDTATNNDIQMVVDEMRAAGQLDFDLAEAAVSSTGDQSAEGEEMMQTVTIRNGEESAADWGIDVTKKNKVRDIALALQARQRKLFGKIRRDQRGPATIRKMADWLASEIEFELQNPNASAVGWYGPKFQSALDTLGRVLPALVDDAAARRSKMPGVNTAEDARALATAIMAVSSNGTNVVKNVENATRLLMNLDETGQLGGVQKHQRAAAINANTEMMVALAEQYGSASAMRDDLALGSGLVADLRKEAKTIDLAKNNISGYPADMVVPRASMYLGPKLAAFYANLSGAEGYLTMDLWWTRTMRRYQGDVLPRVSGLKNAVNSKGEPIGLHRLKHLVGEPSLTDAEAMNIATALAEQYEKKGYKNGTEAEKAANTLHKAANLMLDEAPSGVADRRFFVEIAREAQRQLFDRTGVQHSIADIQALVWYYEKRLMVDMGAKDSLSISYDDAATTVAQRLHNRPPADELFQSGPEGAPGLPTIDDFDPDNIAGLSDEAVYDLFNSDGWAVVSATDTVIGPWDHPDNVQRAKNFETLLNVMAISYRKMEGVYGGVKDGPSFLIVEPNAVRLALDAARDYMQESILTREGIVYTDGSGRDNVPFNGVTRGHAARRTGNYSTFARDDVPGGLPRHSWSLNLQWPSSQDVSVNEGDGTNHHGARVEEDGTIELVHWSREIRETLDPNAAGTGQLPGPERKRSGPKKVFFGINQHLARGYKRESSLLGRFRHVVRVPAREMYSWNRDPDGLRPMIDQNLSEEAQVGAYEQLINDAGYAGYFVIDGNLGDTAVLFREVEPQSVEEVNDAALTRSNNFVKWFNNGAVRNPDGSPRMVFHSSRTLVDFPAFRPFSHFGTQQAAADRAHAFRRMEDGDADRPGTRYFGVYLNMQNPLNVGEERGLGGVPGTTYQHTGDTLRHAAGKLPRNAQRKVVKLLEAENFHRIDHDQYSTTQFNLEQLIRRLENEDPDLWLYNADPAIRQQQLAEAWEAYERGLEQVAAIIRDEGYDGIIYTNAYEDAGSESYIALGRADVKTPWNAGVWDANNPDLLYQDADGVTVDQSVESGPRASIILPKEGGVQAVVNVFENANLSSILHEMGHWQLWTLQKLAKDGNAFAQQQLDEARSWWMKNTTAISEETAKYGPPASVSQVEEFLTVGTTGQGDLDKAIHTALHEQFARGWEAYLMEGKAPTHAMRSIFESFTTWMISIYKSIRGLNVELDDGIRSVFDRMLATEEEMTAAEAMTGLDDEVAKTAKEMGLDEDAYNRLITLSEEARDEGRQKARRDMLEAERRMQSAEYKRRYAEIERQERERLTAEPVHRAIQYLAYGRWIAGEDTTPRSPTGDLMELRLDTAMLKEDYPDLNLGDLPRGTRPVYVKDTLLSADEVAGWFGFDTGYDMIEAMKAAPKLNDAITAASRDRARTELGDVMLDPAATAEVVDDALHGDKHGQLIVAELRALNRVSGGKGKMTSRQQAKFIAQQVLSSRPVREAMQSSRFLAAERRHAEQAARELAAGNPEAAFAEKRKQLIQHAMYNEARRITELVGKAERLAGRLQKKGTRENLAGEYLGAIDDILESYDFRKISGKAEDRRARLKAWLKMMNEQNRMNEVVVPQDVLNETRRVPYKTLTAERLRQVYESLQNIEHTARFKQKLRIAQQERELNDIRAEVRQSFIDNVKGRDREWVPTKGEKFASGFARYLNLARNTDTILRRIDGWTMGRMTELFKRDIDEAAATAEGMREAARIKMQAIFDNHYSRSEQRQMNVRRSWEGIPHKLSRWDLISVVLNMGNQGNLNRLMSKDAEFRFSDAQLEAVKNQMEKRDFDFAQEIWDMLSQDYWPLIQKRERRITGVPPEGVEPMELQTKFGTYRGGYYPINYDSRFGAAVGDEQQQIADEIMMGRAAKAQTRNGFLNARAKGGGDRTVKLGMQVLFGHVNTVIHDLSYSEAVNNTWRLLRDKEIANTFREFGMNEELEALEVWAMETAAGPVGGTHALAGTFRFLKTGFTMSKLLFNMSTVAIQITGLAQSAALLGSVDMARGVGVMFGTSRGWQAIAGDVKEMSSFMDERQRTFHRDMYDLLSDVDNTPLAGGVSRFQRLMMGAGFYAMQKVQYYAVDLPTWIAAYEQHRRAGETHEQSIYYADRMVARAQASGLFTDRTQIERGTLGRDHRRIEFVRLFTALGSYMFAKYNVAEEVAGRTVRDIRDPDKSTMFAIAKGASDMVLLFTVEALLYRLIRGELPLGDDDDDENPSWAYTIATETGLSIMSTLPFVRDASSALQGFGGGGAYGGIWETAGRAAGSAADVVQGEADFNDLRALFDVGGMALPGVPSTQLWRLAKHGPFGPEPDLIGAITGQPSSD